MVLYVYIDENGDLGRKGSKYFVIVSVVCKDPLKLSRIIKRIRERKLKKSLKRLPEIKANKSKEHIRRLVLEKFNDVDAQVYAIVVEKSKIFSHLYDVKNRLYNYIAAKLIKYLKCNEDLQIIIDKKDTNALIRDDFNNYVLNKLRKHGCNRDVVIDHVPSYSSNELQVVDFIAWAVFRNFEHNDESYFSLIKHKTQITNLWEE